MEEKDPFFGVKDGNNEKNLRRMTMRITVMKRMTMAKGKCVCVCVCLVLRLHAVVF